MLRKERIPIFLFSFFLLQFLFFSVQPTVAQSETIDNYNVEIVVDPSGKLTIVENITVFANQQNIKRGIYREFPTQYYDNSGNSYRVGFRVLEVKKNGASEPYHIKSKGNGKVVYIGDKNVYLSPGSYTYTLVFETDFQVGFFENHDELYFNAIGHGWRFPIRSGTVEVTLPPNIYADDIRVDGFTGPQGSLSKNFAITSKTNSFVGMTLTQSLRNFEGFTIVISWPKGFVAEPSQFDRIMRFLKDNLDKTFGLLGILFLLLYYGTTWNSVGRDPEKGTIIPLYESPDGIEPPDARYIHDMSFSNRSLTAIIYTLALKGALTISESSGSYSLSGSGDKEHEPLTDIEKEILAILLPNSFETLKISNKDYRVFGEASRTLKKYLQKKHLKKTFYQHGSYTGKGFLITAGVIFLMLFSLSFDLERFFNFINIGMIVVMFIMFFIYAFLIKAPTKAGRRIMDSIEGYKMYLSTAERDRLGNIAPAAITPELYEHHLPYAVALGVEQDWTKSFEAELVSKGQDPSSYSPRWYSGSRSWNDRSMFGSSLGDTLSSSISSSTSPPGSSSGSGGSSGGGGGGGGGGGW